MASLERFASGASPVLVATDLAARGTPCLFRDSSISVFLGILFNRLLVSFPFPRF